MEIKTREINEKDKGSIARNDTQPNLWTITVKLVM